MACPRRVSRRDARRRGSGRPWPGRGGAGRVGGYPRPDSALVVAGLAWPGPAREADASPPAHLSSLLGGAAGCEGRGRQAGAWRWVVVGTRLGEVAARYRGLRGRVSPPSPAAAGGAAPGLPLSQRARLPDPGTPRSGSVRAGSLASCTAWCGLCLHGA